MTTSETPSMQVAAPPLRVRSSGARAAKRALDLAIAVPAMLVAAPILLVLGLAIRADSRGPILFRQTRVGRDGQPFTLLKLRSMHVDNDAGEHRRYVASMIRGEADRIDGRLYKLVDDPRVTRVGAWIRRRSLDELPQLVNVVRGEMSLVGPRPVLPEEAAQFDERSRGRLAVKPGLTGLWQVSGRSTTTWEEMIDLDLRYVSEWRFRTDVSILFRTPRSLLAGQTA